MERRSRVLLAVGLALAALALGLHYAPAAAAHAEHATAEALLADYEAHHGERALLFGRVVSVRDGAAIVRVRHGSETLELTVTGIDASGGSGVDANGERGVDASVTPGGDIHVLGTVRPGHTIAAERVVTVNRSTAHRWYKYVASGIGALVLAYEFLAYWRFDPRQAGFEVRRDG